MDKKIVAYWKKAAHSRQRELEQAWKNAGLPFAGWCNGVPRFDGTVDWGLVQELAALKPSIPVVTPPPVESEPEPAHFSEDRPKKTRKRRTKGDA